MPLERFGFLPFIQHASGFCDGTLDGSDLTPILPIYDTEDQKSLMKSVCKQLQVDTKLYKERALMSAISAAKDELVSPQEFALRAQGNFRQETVARVYAEYQRQLKSSNALDFDDLIMKTVELFQVNSDILNEYQDSNLMFLML